MVTLARLALSIGAAGVFLAGCGGAQPPIGAPGATPQTLTTDAFGSPNSLQALHTFGGTDDGAQPEATLINVDGTLYGTTYYSETRTRYGGGTVFSLTTSGNERVLHSFGTGTDGSNPEANLFELRGVLYGTTAYGGANRCDSGLRGCGTVFSISPSGHEKVLHSFGSSASDGIMPVAGLISVKGTLYGTTFYGGVHGGGTIFSITRTGTERVLYSFGSQSGDGYEPKAALIDVKGTLFGTTVNGGPHTEGTVFSVTTSGNEQVLYSFGSSAEDGTYPSGGLVDVNGVFYGTTDTGGANGQGTVFSVNASGQEQTLHSFGAGTDGQVPVAGLINVNGTLYGTTINGGKGYNGTIFSSTTSGKEQVLHNFGRYGGAFPEAALLDISGTLYGTTSSGGRVYRSGRRHSGRGIVFALTP